jgi:hypothetical protein
MAFFSFDKEKKMRKRNNGEKKKLTTVNYKQIKRKQ